MRELREDVTFLLLANCIFLHEPRQSNISAPIFIYFCGTHKLSQDKISLSSTIYNTETSSPRTSERGESPLILN